MGKSGVPFPPSLLASGWKHIPLGWVIPVAFCTVHRPWEPVSFPGWAGTWLGLTPRKPCGIWLEWALEALLVFILLPGKPERARPGPLDFCLVPLLQVLFETQNRVMGKTCICTHGHPLLHKDAQRTCIQHLLIPLHPSCLTRGLWDPGSVNHYQELALVLIKDIWEIQRS